MERILFFTYIKANIVADCHSTKATQILAGTSLFAVNRREMPRFFIYLQ